METDIESKLLRIGEAVKRYYSPLDQDPATLEEFNRWIDSLGGPMRSHFSKDGIDKARGVLNFRRFVLEYRDIGLRDYLKRELTPEDFNYFHNEK